MYIKSLSIVEKSYDNLIKGFIYEQIQGFSMNI